MFSANRRFAGLFAAATVLALAACGNTDATGGSPSATTTAPTIGTAFELPEERAYPEGIAVDARTGDTYVGSFTNGAVYRAAAGQQRAEVFLPAGTDGRQTANGLRVDAAGRLWVTDHTAGVAVYDTGTRKLIARFDAPAGTQPFVNDLAETPDGSMYLTDSVRPVVYRVTAQQLTEAAAQGGRGVLTQYADLSAANGAGAPGPKLLNGIVADPSGRFLLVVDMGPGELYRIGLGAQPAIGKVSLRGANMVDGDGLELRGDTLWVVHNRSNAVSRWKIDADGTAAEQQQRVTDESLRIPTTMAHNGNRLLVVVSQFDRGGPLGEGTPSNPFRVVEVSGI